MYLNDEIFKQYEKIHRKGKYASDSFSSSFTGTLNTDDENVYTAFVYKNKYVIRLQVKLVGGKIEDIKFQAYSCTVVMASMNMACGEVNKKSLSEALKLKNADFKSKLKIPDDKAEKDAIMIEEVFLTIADAILSPKRSASRSYG